MARTITFTQSDVAQLTAGELETLEQRGGAPLSRLFSDDVPRGPMLRALALIALQREAVERGEPRDSVSWDDTYDVRVDVADDEGEVGTTGNPTPAGRPKRRA